MPGRSHGDKKRDAMVARTLDGGFSTEEVAVVLETILE